MENTKKDVFLLELYSEEIPATIQKCAAFDLKKIIENTFNKIKIQTSEVRTESSINRIIAMVSEVPTMTENSQASIKGPKVGSPDYVLEGFFKRVGLGNCTMEKALANCIAEDGVYWYIKHTPAMPVLDLLGKSLSKALLQFPWKQSMRWDDSGLFWIRPLRHVLCMLGHDIVPINLGNVYSDSYTVGKKYVNQDGLYVADKHILQHAENYSKKMLEANILVCYADREKSLKEQFQRKAKQYGGVWKEDLVLLEEIAGLTDWPIVYVGTIPEQYLSLPEQVICNFLRKHQKYALVHDENGNILPYFMFASPIVPPDGGLLMTQGNERVLKARLEDALFFVQQDLSQDLENWRAKINNVVWHQGLGTYGQKIKRLEKIVSELGSLLGWHPKNVSEVQQASRLAKLDLVSGMVRELPELQGIMGGYYSRCSGVSLEVCEAIADHYKPVGPTDSLPRNAYGALLACADKADTIVGMFASNQKPTSSRDPFGVRRACIGLLRIINYQKFIIDYKDFLKIALSAYLSSGIDFENLLNWESECISFVEKRINLAVSYVE